MPRPSGESLRYAILTVLGPAAVWFLCRRDQSRAVAEKEAVIAGYRERDERKRSEVFKVTGPLRTAAAELPFHVGLGYGAGEFKHFGALAPIPIPQVPAYAALRGKCHEAHLWAEQWLVACRRAREPGAAGRGLHRPDKGQAMREAGTFKDQVMEECEKLEQKALRGEI